MLDRIHARPKPKKVMVNRKFRTKNSTAHSHSVGKFELQNILHIGKVPLNSLKAVEEEFLDAYEFNRML
jgi:hypothetical protein